MTPVGDAPTPDDVRKLEASWLTFKLVERAMVRRIDDVTECELAGKNGRAFEYQALGFRCVRGFSAWGRQGCLS